MNDLLSILFWPFSGLVLISIVITVHELGHYWVGRGFGAGVESFSIGFGKPLMEARDNRGTRWRINWLPLGGFVKFIGEIQAPSDTRGAGRADGGIVGKPYMELSPLRRICVSLGGPGANFIFAILVFAFMGYAFGVRQAERVEVLSVLPGSPAEAVGFRAKDIVIEAGGRAVGTRDDVVRATSLSAGETVTYRVRRGAEILTLVATPREQVDSNNALNNKEKVGKVGIALADRGVVYRGLNPVEAVAYGFSSTGDAIGATLTVLRRLITGKDGLDKLSGPVGIFTLADKVTDLHMKQPDIPFTQRLGDLLLSWLQLAALLSIGVGFFNLLPIPVLDGGAVVMCAAEAVTGREIPEKVQQVGLTIGLACLVSFALLITWQDLTRSLPWLGGS